MIPVFGLIIGLIVGIFLPVEIPTEYSIYVAVAILAALDSVMGGGVAAMQKRFDVGLFISGFLGIACIYRRKNGYSVIYGGDFRIWHKTFCEFCHNQKAFG